MGSEVLDPELNWDFVQALEALHIPTRQAKKRNLDESKQLVPAATGQAGADPITAVNSHLSHDSSDAWKFDNVWNILHSDVLGWSKSCSDNTQLDDTRAHSSDKTLQSSECAHASKQTVAEKRPCDNSIFPSSREHLKSVTFKLNPTACPSTPQNSKASTTRSSTRASPSAVRILKRPGKQVDGSIVSSLSSQTQKQVVKLNPTNSKPIQIAKKAKQAKKNEPMLSSESSAEAESDSSNIVFDRPTPRNPGALTFVPAQVGTVDVRHDYTDTPPSSYDDADSSLNSDKVKDLIYSSGPPRVSPSKHKTAVERRVFLAIKLLQTFPEYAELSSHLGNPQVYKLSVEPRPIHVFVDISNILVGLHNAVKLSRNIPTTTRIRRLNMSFANFSLIMERRRQATKKVLVGSDRVPSIDEAEKLGYEANILDRVHKSKHTPRPSKFHSKGHRFGKPEMAEASEERWVEQGVDEILHLKMLESLVDTDEPATIVLATGDAAEAEYSGGFLRMVERALQRGWNVELVSFSQLTSYAYKKKEFRDRWGPRFQMIELDHYVEELIE
ncbi:hypothetical protein N7478_002316 [Penicillium angulare]|uniref:uncharacterized protein n=1 Tax=Penicillium angulare TaxID=116970 RepID=UPI00253FDD42|nr:uncharacterized protein N7478_002316 [Penicillium angulare]KAJ5286630.1 hypothetical protein N7478_002316 [Penicillium angulare]